MPVVLNIYRFLTIAFCAMCVTSCITAGEDLVNKSGAFSVGCRESERYATREWATLECSFAGRGPQATSIRVERIDLESKSGARLASAGEIEARPTLVREGGGVSSLAGLALVGAVAVAAKGQSGPVGAATVVGMAIAPSQGTGARSVTANPTDYGTDHLLGPAFQITSGESVVKMALLALGTAGEMPESVVVCTALPQKECLTAPVQLWGGRARLRQ